MPTTTHHGGDDHAHGHDEHHGPKLEEVHEFPLVMLVPLESSGIGRSVRRNGVSPIIS